MPLIKGKKAGYKSGMKKVEKHLKGDISGFKKEIKEDKSLIKKIKGKK